MEVTNARFTAGDIEESGQGDTSLPDPFPQEVVEFWEALTCLLGSLKGDSSVPDVQGHSSS